jgi:predicted  nucleic acid-binding Zn-ribbon protein
MEILVPTAAGELIDKITILEIKSERIADPAKRANVARELAALSEPAQALPWSNELRALKASLKQVNEAIWEIEDKVRDAERDKRFDAAFVALARSVYQTNDKRAALKREINVKLGSAIVEEKSYKPY